jgi:hypothetical protein
VELGEAWSSLWRAGWPGTRARVSGGWRRGQSTREGEVERSEARGVHGHWRGSKKGSWVRGRASWPRNPATCAIAHSPVHGESGEGGTDKADPRCRERKGEARGNGSTLANQARETERERTGKETGADRSAPLGSEREREGAHEGEPPLIGGVRLSGGAGVRARGLAGLSGPAGLLSLFLFL